ncbi:MAG: iron-sulfur cluster co-chaperone HscB C-terminal domain-containing protein, partial [Rhodoferax sp.]|nr:iron-sulfur cluster co-chaperone HscB C-terminal domain-containing protein [Rhodoferax sp.]
EFLMQQMAWREALDEASNAADLDELGAQVIAARRDALQKCGQLMDEQRDYSGAVQQVRALMFIERFASDVEARLDQMDTADRGQ